MLSNPLHQEIASLRSENDELRETVRFMRDMLMPPMRFPRAWRLTPTEGRLLAAFYANPEGLRKESVHAVIDENMEPVTEPKIVDVFICKMRKKLKPYGVAFETQWGSGYFMTPESFSIVGAALAGMTAAERELKEITRQWL